MAGLTADGCVQGSLTVEPGVADTSGAIGAICNFLKEKKDFCQEEELLSWRICNFVKEKKARNFCQGDKSTFIKEKKDFCQRRTSFEMFTTSSVCTSMLGDEVVVRCLNLEREN